MRIGGNICLREFFISNKVPLKFKFFFGTILNLGRNVKIHGFWDENLPFLGIKLFPIVVRREEI